MVSLRIYGTLLVGWKDLRFDNDAITMLFARVYVFSCFVFLICVQILRGCVLSTGVWERFGYRVVVQCVGFCSILQLAFTKVSADVERIAFVLYRERRGYSCSRCSRKVEYCCHVTTCVVVVAAVDLFSPLVLPRFSLAG